MATIRNHVRIRAGADEVWSRITDPLAIGEWFPGMDKVTVDGTRREIRTGMGGMVIEEIVTNDSHQRRFQYRIVGGVPVTEHLATVDVIDLEDGTVIVTYSTEIVPSALTYPLSGAIAAALETLRGQLEGAD